MPRIFTNPVFDYSFPDPFVLKTGGRYYAFATGIQQDGRAFGIATSLDLVHWNFLGGALDQLSPVRVNGIETRYTCYWAPEVTFYRGEYLMYYSVGFEDPMHIRLAIAPKPEGPYIDQGVQLTPEFDHDGKTQFAIDPHRFIDDDGEQYLFYATDFLDYSHIGTGTVVDRMLSPTILEGKPRPVTRARYDWQVYDPRRESKGGAKWHTIEGPFVLKHKGRYYEMFSGGNWQERSYGVSYAISSKILRDDEWEQYADGEKTLPILRTIPGKVIGPGHNSVIRGPNNIDLYCVYHAWSDGQRKLAIDELDFVGERLIVRGPTDQPVRAPSLARQIDFLSPLNIAYPCFVLELSLDKPCEWNLDFLGVQNEIGSLKVTDTFVSFGDNSQEIFPGSTIRITANWKRLRILIDEIILYEDEISEIVTRLQANSKLPFQSAELTYGFSDDFYLIKNLELLGYENRNNNILKKDSLLLKNTSVTKLRPRGNLAMAVNFGFTDESSSETTFQFYPRWLPGAPGIEIEILRGTEIMTIFVKDESKTILARVETPNPDHREFNQLRILEEDDNMLIYLNELRVAEMPNIGIANAGSSLALKACYGEVVLDLVRAIERL